MATPTLPRRRWVAKPIYLVANLHSPWYGALGMVRSYQEDDVLASTLDVIGERWTLLIVRDLLLGPRRFTDLAKGLPRLSRNLLTARLRRLQAEGIIQQRELPAPAAAQVYELTDDGWDLARAVAPLALWGVRRLDPNRALEIFRATTFALGMVAFANVQAAADVHEVCQFDVDGHSFHIEIADGRIRPYDGPATRPDVVITTDAQTCLAIMRAELQPSEAAAAGRMRAEGDPDAALRLLEIFPGPRMPGDAAPLAAEANRA